MCVDTRQQCWECPQSKEAGEIQVGCLLGGGPEMSYSCKAGRNMSELCVHECSFETRYCSGCSVAEDCDGDWEYCHHNY